MGTYLLSCWGEFSIKVPRKCFIVFERVLTLEMSKRWCSTFPLLPCDWSVNAKECEGTAELTGQTSKRNQVSVEISNMI